MNEICKRVDLGVNMEPAQVNSLGLTSRMFLVSLILFDVAINSDASKKQMQDAYYNFVVVHRHGHGIDEVDYMLVERSISELENAGIISNSDNRSNFGGRPKLIGYNQVYNYNNYTRYIIFMNMITYIHVHTCIIDIPGMLSDYNKTNHLTPQ
jgi:hypothetical protein